MKKLILVLVLVFAFALPIWAAEDFVGTVTVGVDYDSNGDLIDSTEISVSTDISDTTVANIVLNVDELITGTVGVDVTGKLSFDWGEGETAEIKAKVDILTGDLQFDGKYLGLSIGDDMVLNVKARYKYPSDVYYTVGTLIYDFNEDLSVIVEARLDSDGAEVFSAEAQAKYAITDDIDLKVGVELNDWADDINDWDDMEIVSDVDLIYAEIVFRF